MSEAHLQSRAKPNVDTWGAFINGDFRPTASGKTFPTFNPGNGEIIAYLAESDEEDVEAAVRAALAAFPAWKRRPGAARAKLLIKLAQLVEANAAKLAELESLNAGKPIRDSKAIDAVTAVDALEYFAGMATKIQGDTIPVPGPYVNMTLREPLGVVGGIIPWNYPLLQAVWKIVPAIAAGNTVVLKPAEQACLSVMYLGRLVELAETEALCDRVGILSGGRLLEAGTIAELLTGGVREWEIAVDSLGDDASRMLRGRGHRVERIGNRTMIRVSEGHTLQEALAMLTSSGAFVHAVEPRRATLEEHFMTALRREGEASS